jgi:hypothetical protein
LRPLTRCLLASGLQLDPARSRARIQDRDDELNEAITREYHFGGEQEDFFTKKAPGAEGEAIEEARKSKREARASAIGCSRALC